MKWQEFEDSVLAFYSQLLEENPNSRITKNVVEDGEFGRRQYDIMIETDVADFCLRTAIECKFHKRKLTIEHIDAFVGKLADSKADKGIMVSSSGFTPQALEKARKKRVEAYTLQEARKAKIDPKLHFPFLLRYIQPEELTAYAEPPPFIDPRQLDIDSIGVIPDLVYKSLEFLNPAEIIFQSKIFLSLKEVFSPFDILVANNSGSPVRISDIKVSGKNIGPIYFGFAHEIPGSLIKINELRPNAQIHCPIDNVHSLTSHFGKVESADEIELHKFAGAMLIICHPPYVDFTVRVYLGTAPST